MCWLTNACPSTTSVIVFLRSAPSARIGPASRQGRDGAGRVAAGPPQDHRPADGPRGRPSRPRGGRWAGSPTSNASAMPPSVLDRVLVAVRDRLARAVGAGHHERVGRAGREEQMVQRRVGQHHAEFAGCRARRRAACQRPRASTIGRADEVEQRLGLGREIDQPRARPPGLAPSARMASPCGTSARASAATAPAFSASHARW